MNVFQKLKKVVVGAYEKHVQKRREEAIVRKVEDSGWLQHPSFRKLIARSHRLARRSSMRIGGPKMTGARLQRVSKSCCPANLTTGRQACTCGQHVQITREDYTGVELEIARAYGVSPELLGTPETSTANYDAAVREQLGLPA